MFYLGLEVAIIMPAYRCIGESGVKIDQLSEDQIRQILGKMAPKETLNTFPG